MQSRRRKSNEVSTLPDVQMNNDSEDKDKCESHAGFFAMNRSDKRSVLLLTFLYVLQGIPLGLAGGMPFILTEKKASYHVQATFSMVTWPFSIKILWAPIVDAIYSNRIGRRKCWLVPIQYSIGLSMLLLSGVINGWIGENGGQISVYPLTACFLFINFLAATQDIVVDGWALTMLSKRNVGWASTCNTVGQTAGYFFAYILFIALESPKFCNNWLRSVPQTSGIVTLREFFIFWGIIFVITTTLVWIFKPETNSGNDDSELSLAGTYMTLLKIIRLKPIQQYILSVFMLKIGFVAADAVTGLKLIERGVPKESMAFLGVMIVPLQIVLPLVLSRYTTGPRPLDTFMAAILPRLIIGVLFAPIVHFTPWFRSADGNFPFSFYFFILMVYCIYTVFAYTNFVSIIAFHAKVSDTNVGGTYMTLLNTCSNLASTLPSTVALYLVDPLTFMTCDGGKEDGRRCYPEKGCGKDSVCSGILDGYYVESAIFFVLGLLALMLRKRNFRALQNLSAQSWLVT